MATLFYSTPTAVADFTDGSPIQTNIQAGESVAYSATAGPTGGSAIVVTATTTASVGAQEVGVRSGVTGGGGRSLKWSFMVPVSGVLTNPSVTNFIWSNSGSNNYGSTVAQVGIAQARTQSGTTGTAGAYRLFLQTPQDSYATLYFGGSQLVRGTWYQIELRLSNDQIILYVTDPGTSLKDAQCYIRGATGASFSGLQLGTITYGKLNNSSNTSYGYSGTLNFAQVGMYSLPVPVAASTPVATFADLWAAKKARDMRHDGAIVRHMGYSAGSTGDGGYGYSSTGGSDIVSEGQAYGAFAAVQAGDQAGANLIFNFAYQTLCRRNSAIATAQNNGTIAGQTTAFAPNLMGFKYQDDLNTFWDGNIATDGDNDMMKAYFLAHGRFGSSSNTVGTGPELAAPNYLQRGINIARDLKTYTFTTVTDSGNTYQIQSADTINGLNELNPSYYDPWAYRLAGQYDTVNSSFWTQALNGTYWFLYKNKAQDTYGAHTEWAALSGSTAQADSGRTSQNGLGYGYNAFRGLHRMYQDYYFYNELKAVGYLAGTIRSSSTSEWNSLGLFAMEKANNGAPFTTSNGGTAATAYEKTANTYGQYVTQKLTTTPTSVAATIKSTKLNWSTLYQPSENGSYIQDAPGGVDSYYMNYWGMFSYALDNGVMSNYSGATTVTRQTGFTLDAVINTSTVSTKRVGFTLDSLLLKTISSGFTLDAVISKAGSLTKTSGFTLDSLLKRSVSAGFTLDAFINAQPIGVTPPTPLVSVTNPSTKLQLLQFCQSISGNREADAAASFSLYLNLAQQEVQNSYSDHPALQASKQFQLVPNVDYSYAFDTDFRKERKIRIVSPTQSSRVLHFIEYGRFRDLVNDQALLSNSTPLYWYWAPEAPSKIHVWPVPDFAYVIQYDYIRYAPDLIADADTPFFDRLYHKMLAFRALEYYYLSDAIERPDKAQEWGQKFVNELQLLQADYQMRQLESFVISYGTGVNEGYGFWY